MPFGIRSYRLPVIKCNKQSENVHAALLLVLDIGRMRPKLSPRSPGSSVTSLPRLAEFLTTTVLNGYFICHVVHDVDKFYRLSHKLISVKVCVFFTCSDS